MHQNFIYIHKYSAELEQTGGVISEELRQKLIGTLLEVLGSGTDEECAICLDSLRAPVITHCAHVFCRPCIESVIKNEKVCFPSICFKKSVLSTFVPCYIKLSETKVLECRYLLAHGKHIISITYSLSSLHSCSQHLVARCVAGTWITTNCWRSHQRSSTTHRQTTRCRLTRGSPVPRLVLHLKDKQRTLKVLKD